MFRVFVKAVRFFLSVFWRFFGGSRPFNDFRVEADRDP